MLLLEPVSRFTQSKMKAIFSFSSQEKRKLSRLVEKFRVKLGNLETMWALY